MKKILLLLIFLIPFCGSSQDISGSWFWQAENGETQMSFTLKAEGSNYTGHHCAVFQNGGRIDCVEGNKDASMRVERTSENEFEGAITSGHSASEGKIQLLFNPEAKTLLFEILEAPGDIYYLPKKAIFESSLGRDTTYKLFKDGEVYKRPIVYILEDSFEKVNYEGEKIFFLSKQEKFSYNSNIHSAFQLRRGKLDSIKFYRPQKLHELEEKEYTAKANKMLKESGFKPIPPIKHSILKIYIVRKQKSGYYAYEVDWM